MVKNDAFRALLRPESEAEVVVERRRVIDGLESEWLGMAAVVDRQRREDASVAESTATWLGPDPARSRAAGNHRACRGHRHRNPTPSGGKPKQHRHHRLLREGQVSLDALQQRGPPIAA